MIKDEMQIVPDPTDKTKGTIHMEYPSIKDLNILKDRQEREFRRWRPTLHAEGVFEDISKHGSQGLLQWTLNNELGHYHDKVTTKNRKKSRRRLDFMIHQISEFKWGEKKAADSWERLERLRLQLGKLTLIDEVELLILKKM